VQRVRVLVVDDSALVRKTVCELVGRDARFEVVGQACNGEDALRMVGNVAPDVVTLDLDMPVMDGMTVLPRLIREHRQRVLILSTLATANSYPTFKALALGAIDFVTKPGTGSYLRNLDEFGEELRRKLEIVATVPVERIAKTLPVAGRSEPQSSEAHLRAPVSFPYQRPEFVIGIGGSTGGTVALEGILGQLRQDSPLALLVVQHLPAGFSQPFARYLATVCRFEVKEAAEGERIRAGSVYLAPGGGHLRVQSVAGDLRLRIDPVSPAVHDFRPSIDALFYSLALASRGRALGLLLSGMGADGVHGLAAIRCLGGRTLVQDAESCVVPDMPARAVAIGAADEIVPLDRIATTLDALCKGGALAWKRVS
jgi:two-component system chemotaxis response regulator CheB